MSKLITVFGATGAQGGPVARALLRSGFRVRAVTRSTDSDKAKALKEAGAEVVAGGVTDAESVKKAVAGAYGVYLVTVVSPDEAQVGKAVADECKRAVVFSSLDSVKDKTGKASIYFDSKSAVEKRSRYRTPPSTFSSTSRTLPLPSSRSPRRVTERSLSVCPWMAPWTLCPCLKELP